MKKLVTAILAVLYLAMTTGVLINVHYCMGELASVEVGHEDHGACEKCGMEDKEGCCHTEHKLIKTDDEHIYLKNLALAAGWTAEIPFVYLTQTIASFQPAEIKHSAYNSPPDIRSNKLGIYYSVFRI